MKNKLFFILTLLILVCFCTSCGDNNTENVDSSLQPAVSSSAASEVSSQIEETLTTLKGIVVSSDEETLTVKIENGTEYTFEIDNNKLTAETEKISSGQRAEISYYGGLDDFAEVQHIDISSIKISNIPVAEKVENMINDMSVEELVGQMFFARCPESNGAELAKKYNLGGYVLFARDFKDKTKDQVINNIKSYQKASDIGMFIGVDEEGGEVVRVSKYPAFRSEKFKSPQELYKEGGIELIESDTVEKAKLLKSLGINLNLAPVCDVPRKSSDYIYGRSFGTDANLTAEYVKSVVNKMNEEKIGCSLKHFPGYGNNNDTHKGIAYDKREYSEFESCDFLPFKAGIEADAGIVMVSHNIVYCMDDKMPASLSPDVHKVLRETLGFNGVIMTDDVSMEGITDFTDAENAAVKAVLAGNDMICCTYFETQVPAVVKAVKSGEISEEQVKESVKKILTLKYKLGIIE